MNCQPVVIIGAARSGTNMLRDIITQLPGYGTWPCDEINLVWRHGNKAHPSDELLPVHATPNVKAYIRGAFDRLGQSQNVSNVVEKTCANSLRVAFVNAILPEAKFVFLIRDGRDATASAMKRWVKPNSLRYTLSKLRYAPLVDVPYYAVGFIANQIHRLRDKERRLGTWGPIFEGMREYAATHTLAEMCATQWVKSVEFAERDLSALPAERVHRMSYEALALQPQEELAGLFRFLGAEVDPDRIRELGSGISQKSVGSWKRDLTSEDIAQIDPILSETLARNQYQAA